MTLDMPYPGLRPFRRDEAHIFFGREEQIDQLLEKLSQTRFLSVVGLSGCGKSSLVRAGMLAALETGFLASAGARWLSVEMRPGNQPLANLAAALLDESVLGAERRVGSPEDPSSYTQAIPFLLASLRRGPMGLVEVLQETPPLPRTNLLLLVDQFEEIFRYHASGGRNEAEAFVNLLLASAEQREVAIYVVLTMRSEFLGDCGLFAGLPEKINESQFLTPRLTREQRQAAILGPAGVYGCNVEPGLVARLLNDMGSDPDQLPLLQHCLMRMWVRGVSRVGLSPDDADPLMGTGSSTPPGVSLTEEDYDSVGGLATALSRHADEAYEELDERGRQIAERLFRCLSERGPGLRDTRRPARLGEVAAVADASFKEVAAVVETFRSSSRCFLTPTAGTKLMADSVLDISHESLIRQWQRMSHWVERETDSAEMYRRLEQTARLWCQSQAALWTTPDLENALAWREQERPRREWAARYGTEYDQAMAFLEASAAAQEERQRREEQEHSRELRRVRLQFIVALLAFLVASGLAAWALVERKTADLERDRAELARSKTMQALDATQHARSVSDIERNRAQQALAETEMQRRGAIAARRLADEQRKRAEASQAIAERQTGQIQQALTDLANAKQMADANLARFREVVGASFGFVREHNEHAKFIAWIQENKIDVLNHVLHDMVDMTESMNEEERSYWHQVIPVMTRDQRAELFSILGEERATLDSIDKKYSQQLSPGEEGYRKGRRALQDGDPAAALSYFTAAAEAEPASAKHRFWLGETHLQRQDWDLAGASYREAITLYRKPDRALEEADQERLYFAFDRLGDLARRAGDFQKALTGYRSAQAAAAQAFDIWETLDWKWRLAISYGDFAYVARHAGRDDEWRYARRAAFEIYSDLAQDPAKEGTAYNGLAWGWAIGFFRDLISADQALAYAETAVSMNKDDVATLDTLAVVRCVRGEFDHAISTYERILQLTEKPEFRKTFETIQRCARGELDPTKVDWEAFDTVP